MPFVRKDGDFARGGVRFKVIGTEPDRHGSTAAVGAGTEIFYEGPLIERATLEYIHVLPYEESLPPEYLSASAHGKFARPSVNEELIKDRFLTRYLSQTSQDWRVGDNFRPHLDLSGGWYAPVPDGDGIWFKVITTKGGKNGIGGIGKNTEIVCRGTSVRGPLPVEPRHMSKSSSSGSPARPRIPANASTPQGGDNNDGCVVS